MPITGFADLQRRSAHLGEIRIGTSIAVPGTKGRQPVRLWTYRLTTFNEYAADVAAAEYGGTVTPWERQKGKFEVTTDRSSLDVWVPPRGAAVDANMELWVNNCRKRKCDGETESESGRPCMCPRDRDERLRLAAMRPPRACSPQTLMHVTLDALPGLTGVWRLATGSASAAVESADNGDVMAIARDSNVFLPATLIIERRYRVGDGSPYPVPALHPRSSLREFASGSLPAGPLGLLAQIQGGPERIAITSGRPPGRPAPGIPVTGPGEAGTPGQGPGVQGIAQRIADEAMQATTQEQVAGLGKQAAAAKAGEVTVKVIEDGEELLTELHPWLQDRWRELPAAPATLPPSAPVPAARAARPEDDEPWPDAPAGAAA